MKLIKADFTHVMELLGTIDFPMDKTVVIYGTNKAGKSNIIHALRYAFLNRVIKEGRTQGYNELKLVKTAEIAPTSGQGSLCVDFEHNGLQFSIIRKITGNRDENSLLRREVGADVEVGFAETLNKELRAALLNALFAPDSAMGFNQLCEKSIDEVIRELFKEIGNVKKLATDFQGRIGRLKAGTQAEVAGIKNEYSKFVDSLDVLPKDLYIDLTDFAGYEAGKTEEKIDKLAETLRVFIDGIEKETLR